MINFKIFKHHIFLFAVYNRLACPYTPTKSEFIGCKQRDLVVNVEKAIFGRNRHRGRDAYKACFRYFISIHLQVDPRLSSPRAFKFDFIMNPSHLNLSETKVWNSTVFP